MSAVVIEHPQAALARYRRIMAEPELYSEDDLADACDHLMLHGGPADAFRARRTMRVVSRRALAEMQREAWEDVAATIERERRKARAVTRATVVTIAVLSLSAFAIFDALVRLITTL